MKYFAPSLTPERLYILDKRGKDWNTKEREIDLVVAQDKKFQARRSMSISEERGRVAKERTLSHAKQVEMANSLKVMGYSNAAIANIMRINESTVRIILTPKTPTQGK